MFSVPMGKVQQTSVSLPCNAEADSLTSHLGTCSLVITVMSPLTDLIFFCTEVKELVASQTNEKQGFSKN